MNPNSSNPSMIMQGFAIYLWISANLHLSVQFLPSVDKKLSFSLFFPVTSPTFLHFNKTKSEDILLEDAMSVFMP